MSYAFDPQHAHELVGAQGEARLHVTNADTAASLGSGDLPILGTPRMIALMEAAACNALIGHVPPQCTTVGSHVDVRHVRPSLAGSLVTARAEVTAVDGSRVTFTVTATQDEGGEPVEVGTGTHVRHVVDRSRFPG